MVFGVGKVQMKFLHLLSTEASHSIMLHCLNDPPYGTTGSLSSTGPSQRENGTLRFQGWNKQMFEKDTLLEPHVLQDECKVMIMTEKCFCNIMKYLLKYILSNVRLITLYCLLYASFFRSKMAAGTSHVSSSILRTVASFRL